MTTSSTDPWHCPECGAVLAGSGAPCPGCGARLRLVVDVDAARRAWLVLFGASSLAAGHGLFLWFAVTRERVVPSLQDLGGGKTAVLVCAFLAAPLVCLAILVLRRRLLALRAPLLRGMAAVAAFGTLAMFAAYLARMAKG